MTDQDNKLYYGDNLDVLRRHIKDETVDLVYLDPPFNSAQDYNVLFKEHSGDRAAAQIKAFEDTWGWDLGAEAAYKEVVEAGGQVSVVMQAFRSFLGESDMMAYLAMMAPRLVELRRVLKSTGSIYLHCDTVASHYLKMLMDSIFGAANFRAEIIWKRSTAHSDTKQGMRQPGRIHDTILFFTKTEVWNWNTVFISYDQTYIDTHYRFIDQKTGRKFRKGDLTGNHPGGDTSYEWHVRRQTGSDDLWEADLDDEYLKPKPGHEYKGVLPYRGRYWAYSKQNMREYALQGRLIHTRTGFPEYKRYLDEMPGTPLQDLWTDIDPINSQAQERLGYPTQKPQSLLERIVKASSNEGDVVLDPFCGCGTTIAAAQELKRCWVGIDITHLAITLMKHRLRDAFGEDAKYKVIGEPVSLPDAEELAQQDPYQFQWWALGLVHARPTEQKKGADKGIDGRIYFHDEGAGGKTKQVILSVKAGHTGAAHVRDLRGVLEREKAEIGVLISMQAPTAPMSAEAAVAGFYDSPGWKKSYPRLQILTIADLLTGATISMPPAEDPGVGATFKRAARTQPLHKQGDLDL